MLFVCVCVCVCVQRACVRVKKYINILTKLLMLYFIFLIITCVFCMCLCDRYILYVAFIHTCSFNVMVHDDIKIIIIIIIIMKNNYIVGCKHQASEGVFYIGGSRLVCQIIELVTLPTLILFINYTIIIIYTLEVWNCLFSQYNDYIYKYNCKRHNQNKIILHHYNNKIIIN